MKQPIVSTTPQKTFPENYTSIVAATIEAGFTMASDPLTCSLLCSLAASKPGGNFLELGTGTGLATAWILDGMDKESRLFSIDFDATVLDIAKQYLGNDTRVDLVLSDGADWIGANLHLQFDYIFADTWHGKYLMLEETLAMLKKGALYIIDDMLPQPNWPEGHDQKALRLIETLEAREDLFLTKLDWSTGLVIAVKK